MRDKLAVLATYRSVVEAEVIVAVLRGYGIRAETRGTGGMVFGPYFQDPTSKGVDVIVSESKLHDARQLLDTRADEGIEEH